MQSYPIAIIGGGAAGMLCAIALHRADKRVLLLEANDRVGKKLLATGNGRCNLSNTAICAERYNNPDFVRDALAHHSPQDTVRLWRELGLLTRTEDTRIYPYSMRANTVLNVLLRNLTGIDVHCNARVIGIQATKEGYQIACKSGEKYVARNVVLASGSSATSGIDAQELFAPFGHRCTSRVPAICAMDCKDLRGVSGVRMQAGLRLYGGDTLVSDRQGELLCKDDQLSGMLAFESSSAAARASRQGKKLRGEIDFVPDLTLDELTKFLYATQDAEDPLRGVLHSGLARLIYTRCGYMPQAKLTQEDARIIAAASKNYPVSLAMPASARNAQVICGGLDTAQFDAHTMQSRLRSGLWAIGEALDVDGECGGYNLHWAWASALAVVRAMEEVCSD